MLDRPEQFNKMSAQGGEQGIGIRKLALGHALAQFLDDLG